MKAEFRDFTLSFLRMEEDGKETIHYTITRDKQIVGDGVTKNIESALDQAHKHALSLMQ